MTQRTSVGTIMTHSDFSIRRQNLVFYSNPEADRLTEQTGRELDPTKRQAVYRPFRPWLAFNARKD
jgi:ABC-type transport system substrate-binding protein